MSSQSEDSGPAPVPVPARGRVLVVDDDRLVLATVVHGLGHAGFDVIDADNGDDAILLARQHRPDLALLDIRMDGMSGFDVARYLRDALQIPFIFLSAFADEATLAQIRALGALASLVKPIDIAQIVPAVEAGLRLARQGRGDELVAGARRPGEPDVPAEAIEPDAVLQACVPIAVGIIMHRFSLSRPAALARLRRLAQQEGRALEQTCAAMVQALEQLALPGAP